MVTTSDVKASIRLAHPPEVVWRHLCSLDRRPGWWWGDHPHVRIDPEWGVGALLTDAAGRAVVVHEWLPPLRLRHGPESGVGGHTFELSDEGQATTLAWTYTRKSFSADRFDPLYAADEEVEAGLLDRIETSLERFAHALDAEPTAELTDTPASEPIPPARQMRVFVSSTFKDMQLDRDELAKRAFVQLRERCRQRGVTWTDVDLRWGITDEQQAEGEVLPICLSEIDHCRPFFIGLLGQRYGWVPDSAFDADAETHNDVGASVTELEIARGVLDDVEGCPHARFYFRSPSYAEAQPPSVRADYVEEPTVDEIETLGPQEARRRAEQRRHRLEGLKRRIEESGLPIEHYDDPRQLADLVVEDLTEIIDRLFPPGSAPTARDREAAAHASVVLAERGSTPSISSLDRLDRLVEDESTTPLLVVGPAGSGRTSVLANWVDRRLTGDERVVFHFAGASDQSGSWISTLQRLTAELASELGEDPDVTLEPGPVRRAFASAIHRAGRLGPVTVVVDGVDELADLEAPLGLAWLPPSTPANVRLVVSTTPEFAGTARETEGWPRLTLDPLEPDEQRRLVVDRLARFGKRLASTHIERLVGSGTFTNPLYATTLLDELRVEADHAHLDETIDHYLRAGDVGELLDLVLARLEGDYDRDRPGLVSDALTLIGASRRGLEEDELLDLLGVDGERLARALWAPLFHAAPNIFANRSGRIGFAQQQARIAVDRRYLPTTLHRRDAHRTLAAHFLSRPLDARTLEELPWQYAQAERWDELAHLLRRHDVLVALWLDDPASVLRYWSDIETAVPGRLLDTYRHVLDDQVWESDAIAVVSELFRRAGHVDRGLALRTTLTDRALASGDDGASAIAVGNEANDLNRAGRWSEALERYEEQELLAESAGISRAIAAAVGGQASVQHKLGRPATALELYQRQASMLAEYGHERDIPLCLGNQAQLLMEQGNLTVALELRRQQTIRGREVSDIDSVAAGLQGQATITLGLGDPEQARSLSDEALQLFSGLGNRPAVATTLINRGSILQAVGDVAGALSNLEQAEVICRQSGERQDLGVALHHQAIIHGDGGDAGRALELFRQAQDLFETLGYDFGLQAALGNEGRALIQAGRPGDALGPLTTQERICRAAPFRQSLVECLNLRGSAFQSMGRHHEAASCWDEARRLVDELRLAPSRS